MYDQREAIEHIQTPDRNLSGNSSGLTPHTPRRPQLEARGFTERGLAAESPNLLAADQSDPVDRVSGSYVRSTKRKR
jgi:osomolarity two-component system sensor histidine kinase NIK1